MDPELKAIKAIIDALEPLDKTTRGRVLRWVSDRYNVGFDPLEIDVTQPIPSRD